MRYNACMMLRLIKYIVVLTLAATTSAGAQEGARFAQQIRSAIVCDGAGETPPAFTNTSCEMRDLDKINPQGKIIWIGVGVDLPDSFVTSEKPLALYIGALASSEIYWNGELVASNGVVGASKALEISGKLDAAFFIPPRLLKVGPNDLAIRMSSFNNPILVRTPFHYLYTVSAQTTTAPLAYFYVPALLTIGAFVLAAVYFGLLWLTDRENSGAIFIALMALFAGTQLFAESLRGFAAYDYPWQIWRLIAVALCAAGFSLAMILYITQRFQPDRWKIYLTVVLALMPIAIIAPGFDAKALVSLLLPVIVGFTAVVGPARRNQKGARLAAAALVGFVALIILDGQNFLDRNFYLAAGGLTVVFFADQARTMRAIKAAKEDIGRRAEQMELELLRRKIAPHFLMNTLNALAEWVESDPKTGVKMIDAFAEELRLLAHMSSREFVPLADEIALCRRHLEVMSYRVDRAFSLQTHDIDERLRVPPGVIHTLVENAFTHGQFADGAEFTLQQIQAGNRITLKFTAPPAAASRMKTKDQGGEGFAYIKKRMATAFGHTASFSSGADGEGRWVSTLSFDGAAP
jgi:Histidine kinase